jgi:hypothetical protein
VTVIYGLLSWAFVVKLFPSLNEMHAAHVLEKKFTIKTVYTKELDEED